MPQSSTVTSPKRPTMTLSGLRSRWMMPRLWANSTARHTPMSTPTCQASGS